MSKQPKENIKEFTKKKFIEKGVDILSDIIRVLLVIAFLSWAGWKIANWNVKVGPLGFDVTPPSEQQDSSLPSTSTKEESYTTPTESSIDKERTRKQQVEKTALILTKITASKKKTTSFSIVYGESNFQSTPKHSNVYKELIKNLSSSLMNYSNTNPDIHIVITTDHKPRIYKEDQLKFTGGNLKINIEGQECFLEMPLEVDQVSINTINHFIKGYVEALDLAIIKDKHAIIQSIKGCID